MEATMLAAIARRRWFQFSLRTLAIVTALVAIVLSWQAQRLHHQRKAIAAIRQLGGQTAYDYQMRGETQPPGPMWLRRLTGDDFFASVAVVKVNPGSRIYRVVSSGGNVGVPLSTKTIHLTNEDLKTICSLEGLRYLDLSGTDVTDQHLPHLETLKSLTTLYLDDGVSDQGRARLQTTLPATRIN
jgi:hypothetical protein